MHTTGLDMRLCRHSYMCACLWNRFGKTTCGANEEARAPTASPSVPQRADRRRQLSGLEVGAPAFELLWVVGGHVGEVPEDVVVHLVTWGGVSLG